MSHDAFLQLAAGRVLEDLDPAESAALDDHVAACAPCRSELQALGETAAAVALLAPRRRPSAALRDRVVASIAGLAVTGRQAPAMLAPSGAAAIPWARDPVAGPGSDESSTFLVEERPALAGRRPHAISLGPAWAAPRWTSLASLAVAAVLVVAVAGLALNVVGLQGRLDATIAVADAARADALAARTRTDALGAELATMDSAVGVALAPAHRTAALTAEGGAPGLTAWTVYVPGSTDALFVARGLPPAPAGHVYQLWYADGAGVHPLATFTCSAVATCIVPFGVDLGEAAATMVTVEPEGGSTGQPGPQVAFGELES